MLVRGANHSSSLSSLPMTPESNDEPPVQVQVPKVQRAKSRAGGRTTSKPNTTSHAHPQQQQSTTLDWKWALATLSSTIKASTRTTKAKDKTNNKLRCFVNLTDTLVIRQEDDDDNDDDDVLTALEDDDDDDDKQEKEEKQNRWVRGWLFTDQTGVVARHPKDQITLESIEKRFLTRHATDKVAIVNYSNGTRRVVDAHALKEILQELFDRPQKQQQQQQQTHDKSIDPPRRSWSSTRGVVGIQKYVTCQSNETGSAQSFLLGEYGVDESNERERERERARHQQQQQDNEYEDHDGETTQGNHRQSLGKTRVFRLEGDFFSTNQQQQQQQLLQQQQQQDEQDEQDDPSTEVVSKRLHKEVETMLQEMVRQYQRRWFLNHQQQVNVLSMKAEFVVDENHRVWLMHVPYVTLQLVAEPKPKHGQQQHHHLKDVDQVVASKANNGPASVHSNKPKCRGDFCHVVPLTLRGLYADVIQQLDALQQAEADADAEAEAEAVHAHGEDSSARAGGEDANRFRQDQTLLLEDETGRIDQVLDEVGTSRFRIGYNNVLLAREEMEFISGQFQQQIQIQKHASQAEICTLVATQWQELDNFKRSDLGRTNPQHFYKQVHVCANCHRIYSKLASHRANGFATKNSRRLLKQHATTDPDEADPLDPSPQQVPRQHRKALEQLDNEYDKQFLMELAKQSQQIDAETAALQLPQSSSSSTNSTGSDHANSSRSERSDDPVVMEELNATIPVIVTNPRNKKQQMDPLEHGSGGATKLAFSGSLDTNPKTLLMKELDAIQRPNSVHNSTQSMPALPPTIVPLNTSYATLKQNNNNNNTSSNKKDKKNHNTKRLLPLNQSHHAVSKGVTGATGAMDAAVLLKSFETKVTVLESQLQASQQELGKSRQQYQQLLAQTTQQFEALQQEHRAIVHAKEEEIRQLRRDHQQEMIHLHHAPQPLVATKASSTPPAPSALEMTNWIETIDTLNAQLNQMVTSQEALKRQWEDTKQKEIFRVQSTFQTEIDAYRLQIHHQTMELEDKKTKITTLENQQLIASTQILQLKKSIDQLQAAASASAKAASNGDATTTTTTGTTTTTTNTTGTTSTNASSSTSKTKNVTFAADTSTTESTKAKDLEALEKHLNNKIEYLKAQVASEMRCKEELGANLSNLTLVIETLKKDKKKALVDAEESHKRAMEKLMERHQQENEISTSTLSSLQAKVVALQANVSDLVQANVVAKNREEQAKLALDKLAHENTSLNRQVVDLESTVEALQEKYHGVQNTIDEAQRVNLEATLRRLDNERIYLKNQLDTEVGQKNQFLQANLQLTHELQRQKQHNTETMTRLHQELAQKDLERTTASKELQEHQVLWQMESQNLKIQVSEAHQKAIKLQEQKLLLTNDMEFARQEAHLKQQTVVQLQQELIEAKQYLHTFQERNSKALQTLKHSLSQLELDKNDQLTRLQTQLEQQQQQEARLVQDHVVQMGQLTQQMNQFKKIRACVQLFAWVRRHGVLQRQRRGFDQLHMHQLRHRWTTVWTQQKQDELNGLQHTLRQQHMDQTAQITAKFTQERTDILHQMEAQWRVEKQHMQQDMQNQLHQLETHWADANASELQRVQQQFQQQKQAMQQVGAQTVQAVESQWAQRLQDKQQELEAKAKAFDAKETQLHEEFQHELARQLDEWQRQVAQEKHNLQASFQTRLEDTEQAHAQAICQAQAQQEQQWQARLACLHDQKQQQHTEQESRIDMLQQDHASQLMHLLQHVTDQSNQQHAQDLEHVNAHWQQQLQDERQANQRALQAALARMESQSQLKLETLIGELKEQKHHAILQNTLKWQHAMDELQQRHELDKKLAYETGLREREQDWQKAALQIKQKQAEELDRVQQEAVQAIQACEQKHALAMHHAQETWSQQLQQTHQLEIHQLEESWQHKMQEFKQAQQENLEIQLQQRERQFISQLEAQKTEWNRVHQQTFQDQMHQLDATHAHQLAHQRAQWEATLDAQKKDLEQQLQTCRQHQSEQLEQLQQQHQTQLKEALASQHQALQSQFTQEQAQWKQELDQQFAHQLQQQEQANAKDQQDAIAQVQLESEKLIDQVESAMHQLKLQKDTIATELDKVRDTLEHAEDQFFDLQQAHALLHKKHGFTRLYFCLTLHRFKDQLDRVHQQQLDTKTREFQSELAMLHQQLQHATGQHAVLQQHQGTTHQSHEAMYELLVQYKRDELIQLKSASAVLANELKIFDTQQDELTDLQHHHEQQLHEMKQKSNLLEAEIKECALLRNSVVSDDGLVVQEALAAKKRRLHEEFESSLAQMDAQRVKIRTVELKQRELQQQRQDKDQETKRLERQLVQILVEQQKKLLQLVTSVREASALLQATTGSATAAAVAAVS